MNYHAATALAALALAVAPAAVAGGCRSAQPIDELRTHADEAFVREEYKRAIAFDNEIIRMKPDDYSATVQRGVSYDRVGSFGDAQADYARAIELAPDAALPRLYRANLALKANQPDMALEDVKALNALELEKHEQVAALCLTGTVAQKKGDWRGALRWHQQAIELGRSDPDPVTAKHYRDALYNASECCYRMGDFNQATALFIEGMQAKVRADEPITEDDQYTLGVLQYLNGDFARARQSFARVSPARQKNAAKLFNDDGFFASAK